MKKQYLLLALLQLAIIVGCNQITIGNSYSIDKEKGADLRIEPKMTDITEDQAVNVARIFDISQGRLHTKAVSEYSDIYTLYNEEGMPIFYAVNRRENTGFVIVGASRNYYPILAFSDKGHFDENYDKTGLSLWANRQIVTVTAIEKDGVRDEAIDFDALWRYYDNRNRKEAQSVKTKSEAEAFALRQASVAAWEAQGYTCYALMDCPDDLPSATYASWCASAQSFANPEYSYLTYSVILERRVDIESTKGPLMGYSWEQENGYNSAVPYYENGEHKALGCATVAVGQIMRYFQNPTDTNWVLMPPDSVTSTTANFLYSLGCNLGVNYAGFDQSVHDRQVRDSLQNKYRYSSTWDDFSNTIVQTDIQSNSKPVYIGGVHTYPNNHQIGHAWVCEGYKYVTFYYEYELKILSVVPPLQYETLASTQSAQIGSTSYFYYNLGMGYNLNGWYYSGDIFSNLDGQFENLKMLYNITPPSD